MKDKTQSQHDLIRSEFKKQAEGWGKRQDKHKAGVDLLDFQPHFTVLDVAAGSGIVSSVIAPQVKQVVALDITPEMLDQARKKGFDNLQCVMGTAENMPHADDTFDCVVTRYSLHHVVDPEAVIREMYRVCQLNGHVMVTDILSPDDPEEAERYNHLERLRDPSHTNALTLDKLKKLFLDAGFREISHPVDHMGEMDIEGWFDLTQTPTEVRTQVRKMVLDDLNGKIKTGFHPVYRDDRLKIVHRVAVVIGLK